MQVAQLITEDIACLHDYTLQASQMRMLENTEIVIKSGAGLEDFWEDISITASTVVDASQNIPLLCSNHQHDHAQEHHHNEDPHYWLYPSNAKIMSANICTALTAVYPEYASTFAKNLESLEDKINVLQNYAETQLANLSCRELVTFHDGFSYMADAFDLEIIHAIAEESGSEASAQELILLTKLIESHHLPAVFTERNGSTSSAAIVALETNTPVFSLDMAMSGEGYFNAMYCNIDTLKEALE